jgi:heme-degrading monooxygenase HmoA
MMRVVTIVRGKVPPERREGFEAAFASMGGERPPRGLVESLLIRSSDESGNYAVLTVWSGRESLEASAAGGRPRDVALFEDAGAFATGEVSEIAGSYP